MAKNEAGKNEAGKPDMFTKDQVLSSKRYKEKKDILCVVLDAGKLYSIADVDARIDQFMKGKVK